MSVFGRCDGTTSCPKKGYVPGCILQDVFPTVENGDGDPHKLDPQKQTSRLHVASKQSSTWQAASKMRFQPSTYHSPLNPKFTSMGGQRAWQPFVNSIGGGILSVNKLPVTQWKVICAQQALYRVSEWWCTSWYGAGVSRMRASGWAHEWVLKPVSH